MTMIWSSVGLYMVVFSLFGWEKTRRILAIKIYCKKTLAVRSDSGDSGIARPFYQFLEARPFGGFSISSSLFPRESVDADTQGPPENRQGLWGSVRENAHGDKDEWFNR
jgi:hypothetical protein